MPTVTVNPVNTIKVRVGSATQPVVSGTTTFVGSSLAQAQIDAAMNMANAAFQQSNTAITLASNALPTTGGEITGNLAVDGTFTAVVDGGTFT